MSDSTASVEYYYSATASDSNAARALACSKYWHDVPLGKSTCVCGLYVERAWKNEEQRP